MNILYPWAMCGEYADGFNTVIGGDDIGDCLWQLDQLSENHGDLIWYGGLCDDNYNDGERIIN